MPEARVLQHELDHLDGVLTLDRTTKEQRREALRELRTAAERMTLAALRDRVEGEVLLPGDAGFDAARRPAIPRFHDAQPAAVVRCRTPADVAARRSRPARDVHGPQRRPLLRRALVRRGRRDRRRADGRVSPSTATSRRSAPARA